MATGMVALETSKIALQKAQNADVKMFAKFESDEQQGLAEVLRSMQEPATASSGSAADTTASAGAAPQMDAKHREMVQKLQQASAGPAFDKEYLQGQLQGHRELLQNPGQLHQERQPQPRGRERGQARPRPHPAARRTGAEASKKTWAARAEARPARLERRKSPRRPAEPRRGAGVILPHGRAIALDPGEHDMTDDEEERDKNAGFQQGGNTQSRKLPENSKESSNEAGRGRGGNLPGERSGFREDHQIGLVGASISAACIVTAGGSRTESLMQAPRDHLRLDLGGALEDRQDPGVAEDPGNRVFEREAVAAMDLGHCRPRPRRRAPRAVSPSRPPGRSAGPRPWSGRQNR